MTAKSTGWGERSDGESSRGERSDRESSRGERSGGGSRRPGGAVRPNVDADRVRTALTAGDALGGFFALGTRPAEAVDPSWRPVSDLLAGEVLDQRIDEVAAQLGGTTRRIAASLLQLSLASRPVAILLAAAAEHGVLLHLPPDVLHWRPWSGGPVPLWVDVERVTGTALGASGDPGAVVSELADVHLAPLVDAVRARTSVSPRVLWGNATSALGGAVRMLALERPAVRDAALALARGMLETDAFAGLGGFVPAPSDPTGFGFARRTCCLIYRVPGGGPCGDCVLNVSPGPGSAGQAPRTR